MKFAIAPALLLALLAAGGCGEGGSPTDPDESGGAGLSVKLLDKRVRTPANVTLSFQVKTAEGDPVTNLTAADFRVLENGEPISAFESAPQILPKPGRFVSRTVLLLDLSGSILGSSSLPALMEAARSFVISVVPATASPTTEVGIWWFDGETNLHSLAGFTTNRATLLTAIDRIPNVESEDNSTNLNGAVIRGLEIASDAAAGDRAREVISSNSVVVFTDGTDQALRRTAAEVQSAVNRYKSTVGIYTIGLEGEINETTLRTIGINGYFPARDVTELVSAFTGTAQRIAGEANSFYVLEYCSPKRAGTHTVRLEGTAGARTGWVSTTFSASGFRGGCRVTG